MTQWSDNLSVSATIIIAWDEYEMDMSGIRTRKHTIAPALEQISNVEHNSMPHRIGINKVTFLVGILNLLHSGPHSFSPGRKEDDELAVHRSNLGTAW